MGRVYWKYNQAFKISELVIGKNAKIRVYGLGNALVTGIVMVNKIEYFFVIFKIFLEALNVQNKGCI